MTAGHDEVPAAYPALPPNACPLCEVPLADGEPRYPLFAGLTGWRSAMGKEVLDAAWAHPDCWRELLRRRAQAVSGR